MSKTQFLHRFGVIFYEFLYMDQKNIHNFEKKYMIFFIHLAMSKNHHGCIKIFFYTYKCKKINTGVCTGGRSV